MRLLPRAYKVSVEVRRPFPGMTPVDDYPHEIRARSANDALHRALRALEQAYGHGTSFLSGVDALATVSREGEEASLSFPEWEVALRSVGRARTTKELLEAALADRARRLEAEAEREREEERLSELAALPVSSAPRQRPSGLAS